MISEDKTEYELIVSEVFKGELRVGSTVKGINPKYCAPSVDKKGQWLFFGTFSSNFHLNECGLTSNIKERWRIPPPPLPKLKADEKKMIAKWKKEARKNVQEQIIILRNQKE